MENIENQGNTSKKDALLEKLRSRYPDKEFADDEAYSDQIAQDYDDMDNQIAGYKEREGKITDLFNKDARSAQFLTDWMNDGDPRIQLLRSYGKEGILAAFDDPEKMEAMAQADREFVENTANEKKLEDEYKANLAQSCETLDQFAQEHGYNDEQMDQAVQYLLQSSHDVIMGKFTPEAITGALHAINHDKDVEAAGYEGEVRGKNTAIDVKLRKAKGDGMATLQGGAGGNRQSAPSIPGALGRDKKDIYAAGGFTRIPRK